MTASRKLWLGLMGSLAAMAMMSGPADAQQQQRRPNVIVIFGDDVGWGDLGAHGGGETRGAPTPNLD